MRPRIQEIRLSQLIVVSTGYTIQCIDTDYHRGPKWKANLVYTNSSFHLLGTKLSKGNTQLFAYRGKNYSGWSRAHLAIFTECVSSQTNKRCLCKSSWPFTLGLYGSQYDYVIHVALIGTAHMSLISASTLLWEVPIIPLRLSTWFANFIKFSNLLTKHIAKI